MRSSQLGNSGSSNSSRGKSSLCKTLPEAASTTSPSEFTTKLPEAQKVKSDVAAGRSAMTAHLPDAVVKLTRRRTPPDLYAHSTPTNRLRASQNTRSIKWTSETGTCLQISLLVSRLKQRTGPPLSLTATQSSAKATPRIAKVVRGILHRLALGFRTMSSVLRPTRYQLPIRLE